MLNHRGSHDADMDYDHLVKLLLLGDSAVGKSSLMMRFCEEKFEPSFVLTIGVDFKTRTVKCGNKSLKIQVWDTAGQERFRSITPAYFRSAMGVLLVYDVTSNETFNNLKVWMRSIEEYADPLVQRILIGNKSDLDHLREVPILKGRQLAEQYQIPFYETSAKLNHNVLESFLCIADAIRTIRFPINEAEESIENNESFVALKQKELPQSVRRKCCG